MDKWLSGRKRRITNPENEQSFRGFESYLIRQF
jgi:hypothetical protein